MSVIELLFFGINFYFTDVRNALVGTVAPALIGLAVVGLGISLGIGWVRRIRTAV